MNLLADVAMAALSFAMVGLLDLGIARSARLGGRDEAAARKLGVTTGSCLLGWLAISALLAKSGVLSDWTATPPRWPFLPLTALLVMLTLSSTSLAKSLAASTPRHLPIAAQTFRVAVELIIFALYKGGRAPVQITFEGRNFDILVGLTAPLAAWFVWKKRAPPALVMTWNLLGLAILASTVATIATSTPGPLLRDWPGQPFSAIATWPVIWLPAFLAPLAVFFHIVSLRQTLGALQKPGVST